MSVRRLTKEEWAYEIQRAERLRDVQRVKLKRAKYVYVDRLFGRLMPLPYIIGFSAAVTLFLLYGWREFLKFFLSWCVSLTLVATGAYHLWKYYEKQL